MGRPVVIATNGRPVTQAFGDFGEPVTIASNGFGEPVVIVNSDGAPVNIEDGEPFALGASLLSWWDAGHGTGSTWVDRKSGRVMTVSGATWGATSFNGAPGWTFDGVDDYMTLESQPFPSGSAASEIFALFQQNALVGEPGRNLVAYGTAGNFGRSIARVGSSLTIRSTQGNGAGNDLAADNTVSASSRHVAHATFGASAVTISMDGNTPVSTASTANTGTTRVRIGANLADTPALFWNGIVSDILVCGPLTAAQRSYMQTFLLARRML